MKRGPTTLLTVMALGAAMVIVPGRADAATGKVLQSFRINRSGSTLTIPVYSSLALDRTDTKVTRAVVIIHGSSRSSSDALDSAKAAVPSDVLVVAPRFKTSSDSPSSSALYWTKSGWNQGADSTGSRPWHISSFEAASALLTEMRATYRNRDTIVIAGHSAGGQFVQRLAATNTDARNHFVVANPSSCLYFDDLRPVGSGFGKPSDACSWYNNYRYGLDDRTEDSPYMGNISRATLPAQYGQSRVTYLLGAKDTDSSASDLDVSCEAKAQGAHRLERGQKFYQHLPAVFGSGITARHSLSVVSNVGHSASQMFSSSAGRRARPVARRDRRGARVLRPLLGDRTPTTAPRTP